MVHSSIPFKISSKLWKEGEAEIVTYRLTLINRFLRGVGAMEIVAIDMKLRGMYMARQLSFSGVNFSIKEVQLIDKFVEAYDASVKLVGIRRTPNE